MDSEWIMNIFYVFVWWCHFYWRVFRFPLGTRADGKCILFFCFYHSFSYHLPWVAMVILPKELPHGNTSFSLRKTCASWLISFLAGGGKGKCQVVAGLRLGQTGVEETWRTHFWQIFERIYYILYSFLRFETDMMSVISWFFIQMFSWRFMVVISPTSQDIEATPQKTGLGGFGGFLPGPTWWLPDIRAT